MANEDAGATSDPFAGAKANLRDTIKWLATAFAALASAVLAGASITGISGLQGSKLAAALLAGAAGLLCIFVAIGILLRLLTSESFFLAQLGDGKFAPIKKRLASHSDDILSPVFHDLDDFLCKRNKAVSDIRKKPQTEEDEANWTAKDEANYEAALKFFSDVSDEIARLVSLAHFEVLRSKLKSSELALFALAIGAIAGIGSFAALTGSGKGAEAVHPAISTFELMSGKDWRDVGQALAEACGNVATLKAEVIGQAQPGWLAVRLLSPEPCAGMLLDVPARLVVRPALRH